MNRVSQDWLFRPMGIFQLIDYVGVDVFQFIVRVMDQLPRRDADERDHRPDDGAEGPRAASAPTARRRTGSSSTRKGRITRRSTTRRSRAYVPLDPRAGPAPPTRLGRPPAAVPPVEGPPQAPDRDEALAAHFKALADMKTLGRRARAGLPPALAGDRERTRRPRRRRQARGRQRRPDERLLPPLRSDQRLP